MTPEFDDFHTRLLAEQRRAAAANRLRKLASGDYLELDPGHEASGEDLAALHLWQQADPANRGAVGVSDSKPIKYRINNGPEQTFEPEGDIYRYKPRTLKSSDIGLAKQWLENNKLESQRKQARLDAAEKVRLEAEDRKKKSDEAFADYQRKVEFDAKQPQGRLAQAQYDAIQADIERKAKEAARQSEPINIEAVSYLSPQAKRDFDEYVQRMPEREAYSKAKDNERRREMEAVTELSSMYGGAGALTPEQGSQIEQYLSQNGLSPDKLPLAIRNKLGSGGASAEDVAQAPSVKPLLDDLSDVANRYAVQRYGEGGTRWIPDAEAGAPVEEADVQTAVARVAAAMKRFGYADAEIMPIIKRILSRAQSAKPQSGFTFNLNPWADKQASARQGLGNILQGL